MCAILYNRCSYLQLCGSLGDWLLLLANIRVIRLSENGKHDAIVELVTRHPTSPSLPFMM